MWEHSNTKNNIVDQHWHHRLLEAEHSVLQGMVRMSSQGHYLQPTMKRAQRLLGTASPLCLLNGDGDVASKIIVC